MLGDYLRSFWRGILHNKVATFINVSGLSLGLAVFFALTFYVNREFSWDKHWEDADRIYVTVSSVEGAGGTSQAAMMPGPWVLGDSLQARHPEAIEAYARYYQEYGTVVVGEDEYPSMGRYHIERSLLDLFQLETLEGSLTDALAEPRSIAISKATAERIFGKKPPLGQTVTFKSPQGRSPPVEPRDFIIKAVFDIPGPTTFNAQFLTVLEPTALPATARFDIWDSPRQQPAQPPQPNQAPPVVEYPLSVTHYFKVREGVDVKALEADMRGFMDENRYMDNGLTKTRYVFRHMHQMHLSPSLFDTGDNVQRLWVYAFIGVLVLLISGCNFVMLATLRLVDRMREVGVRKSVGGGGGQLMWQYLTDAFLHTLLAAILAIAFLTLAFPKLSVMLELPLQLDLMTPRNLGLCLLMIVLFTLASSLYPAWLTSQVKPGPLLRNGGGAVVGTGTGLRKLLVGVQFAVVVVLLLATAVVYQQINYTRHRDPGYNVENIIAVRVGAREAFQRTTAIVAEFNKVPGVEVAAGGSLGPGTIMIAPPTIVRTIAPDGSVREAGLDRSGVAAGYFRVMSTRVLAGREFDAVLDAPPVPPGAPTASGAPPPAPNPDAPLPEGRVILNESAAKLLGFAEPAQAIDQLVEIDTASPDQKVRKQSMRVVGVVVDTQLASVMLPPKPQIYSYSPTSSFLAAKLQPGADAAAVTDGLRAAWDSILPGTEFITQDNATMTTFQLRREEFEARIITGSTLLAIVIALLGLYGLVAATVVKRVKEIGVRKVMGAERSAIVTLFLVQFSKPIVVANVIAWPFGFWAIRQWLQRFPYQLDVSVIVLSGLAASIAALAIAWLTVGVMAARASSVKPVIALRYE